MVNSGLEREGKGGKGAGEKEGRKVIRHDS